MVDVFIGYLDDPDFHWDGGDWNGNIPHRKSPFFPNASQSFSAVIKKIKEGKFEGKKVDWGGFVAKLTTDEIEQFLDEQNQNDANEWTQNTIKEIKEFLHTLDKNKQYALVACEI